jgi:lysophospholipase L1-like esterase
VALAGALGIAAAGIPSAVAAGLQEPPARTYYVAVGASESLGVQPTATSRHSVPTDDGYANALVAMERSRWPGLQLVHFGCPGITAQAALLGGGPCRFAAGSEIQAAADFLRRHPGKSVLATVDLGFNDVWPCLAHRTVDAACVTAAFAVISRVLPVTLHDLRAAGGPDMKMVGLLHNDPCLASYLRGPAGQAFSAAALAVFDRFNTLLSAIYTRAGVSIANVPAAFAVGTPTTAALGTHGTVPLDVAKVCTLTWMCRERNLHPNAAGYQAIADAIAAALPRPS